MKPRDNPFRAQRIDALTFRPQSTTWPAILQRMVALGNRAAIVGPHGSGKTTLLDQLRRQYAVNGHATAHLRLNSTEWRQTWRSLLRKVEQRAQPLVFLDGADLLPLSTWRRLMQMTNCSAAGLIITSHRPGLLPTLLETQTSSDLLSELVSELTGEKHLGTGHLFASSGGDIRQALRSLYHTYSMR